MKRITLWIAIISTPVLSSLATAEDIRMSSPCSKWYKLVGDECVSKTTYLDSRSDAASFLARASFGGTIEDIDELTGSDAAHWLQSQFNSSPTEYLLPMLLQYEATEGRGGKNAGRFMLEAAIDADDQLRQRMIFALSQILVVSDSVVNDKRSMGHYLQILSDHAFGNYRDLLQEVTYSPAMARYLTYFRNRKGNPETGRQPDENYARELLQLFTIGLVELKQDGSVVKRNGQAVETFTTADVEGLARVFTGLSYKGHSFRTRESDLDASYSPLQMYDQAHSELDKSFLGLTIPAGTPGDESINQALDHIFAHRNLAPFISRQLIQRFVTSHPRPSLIRSVSRAFNTGQYVAPDGSVFGTGRRGDLTATLSAVLLRPSVYNGRSGVKRAMENGQLSRRHLSGKVREPILRYVHWARAFGVASEDLAARPALRRVLDNATVALGQHPFKSRSVFNFYRPGYIAPNSYTGDFNLTIPELQITDESSSTSYINAMNNHVLRGAGRAIPELEHEMALAADPHALVDHLDLLLTANTTSGETKERIVAALNSIDIVRSDIVNEERRARRIQAALESRVNIAVAMFVSSPAFAVQH